LSRVHKFGTLILLTPLRFCNFVREAASARVYETVRLGVEIFVLAFMLSCMAVTAAILYRTVSILLSFNFFLEKYCNLGFNFDF
jgi:hypothetical protein